MGVWLISAPVSHRTIAEREKYHPKRCAWGRARHSDVKAPQNRTLPIHPRDHKLLILQHSAVIENKGRLGLLWLVGDYKRKLKKHLFIHPLSPCSMSILLFLLFHVTSFKACNDWCDIRRKQVIFFSLSLSWQTFSKSYNFCNNPTTWSGPSISVTVPVIAGLNDHD